MIRVQQQPFDPAAELAGAQERARGAGALVSFLGLVRGDEATALELSHFAGFTEAEIERIGEEARARFAIGEITIVHRFGTMEPGESIVFVAVSGRHRRAAFDAVDYLMDRLKTDAPFWKKELTSDGSRWIEPREEDLEDRRRWGEGAERATRN